MVKSHTSESATPIANAKANADHEAPSHAKDETLGLDRVRFPRARGMSC